MSDTPRTDVLLIAHDMDPKPMTLIFHSRELERELNAANGSIELLTACNDDVARIAKERNDALERIKRLEEFVEQLTNPKFTRDDLPNEALLQRIKRLEEAGDALSETQTYDLYQNINWRKAKEAKP